LNRTSVTYESVKKILNGGGGLSTELTKDTIEIFLSATLMSAYGMTEACSSLTFMTLFDPTKTTHQKYHSSFKGGICVGQSATHVKLKISPDEKSSKTGEILMRGPHVMLGYWGQSTSKSNHSKPGLEDWLDTGDIGLLE
ncbi:2-succinylbenzoate--CoA ligase-chloroplastic/peroxisomal, partial [Striga hermonthica]